MTKKICFLITCLITLAGCTSDNPQKNNIHKYKEVKVMIEISDPAHRYHYYGISVNQTPPDKNTIMIGHVKWIKKKTETVLLRQGARYRIDVIPATISPIKAQANKLKQANHPSVKSGKTEQPLRKYITVKKENQKVRFVVH